MSDSRADLIAKIESQRATVRLHVQKYKQFKKNGDYTSTAETTISNAQSVIRSLKSRDRSIDSNWEDNCNYEGN